MSLHRVLLMPFAEYRESEIRVDVLVELLVFCHPEKTTSASMVAPVLILLLVTML